MQAEERCDVSFLRLFEAGAEGLSDISGDRTERMAGLGLVLPLYTGPSREIGML